MQSSARPMAAGGAALAARKGFGGRPGAPAGAASVPPRHIRQRCSSPERRRRLAWARPPPCESRKPPLLFLYSSGEFPSLEHEIILARVRYLAAAVGGNLGKREMAGGDSVHRQAWVTGAARRPLHAQPVSPGSQLPPSIPPRMDRPQKRAPTRAPQAEGGSTKTWAGQFDNPKSSQAWAGGSLPRRGSCNRS
jgi:hypothetical protein